MERPHRVLLTGANGYIAQHILSQLLEAGHSVRAVVRSQSKVDSLKKTFGRYVDTPQLDFGVVPDITVAGSFDDVLVSHPPFDTVMHTASPFFLRPVKGEVFLDPAIKGTTEILKSITRVAPSVKRVTITSSFAAIGSMHTDPISNPARTYTCEDWNIVTLEEASVTENPLITYPASKKFAEKAAWDFVKENEVKFELATLNPPAVFGPLVDPSQYTKPDQLGETCSWIYNSFISSSLKASDPVPPTFVYVWIDVRDLARAHLLAMTVPEAANKRWFPVGGELSMQGISNILRETLPEKRDTIPIGEPEKTTKPEGFYECSAPEVEKVLGLTYRSAKQSIGDLAPQLVDIEKRAAAAGSSRTKEPQGILRWLAALGWKRSKTESSEEKESQVIALRQKVSSLIRRLVSRLA
ncbi:putative NADPH-dependent methylglyoxal reductase GRE2 [Annulohypoxylon maeteangense]|uniref:putative NADPH-dependent methylglyoxal reductase GRE2 n=1 Tax=Annulohypoxylon maeteangense TaxID=1927788 RepID=UPI00200884EC|nr:putative NADPH-dependent methylglyoxal reductase GRE2 [Annulohypoxylon maeteangense]KAI0880716.1 putative NADPH-dependent methylglyoxal reductase GRE2 [Annulohypoxylon maeteangense]